uniref:Uncharacterized protein n=1 Tax=Chromera velia CCMP2878 TaxID=1169474 RepID=A0A0G4FTK4_9ALVE|eukprot:Cvel_18563.t1-p1 / transcript=Cvel_18563.t1 / gene=Cvel_18563 / organism=Chromera_velia_CCMP2878 / gene_product=hypothetical protein / transcript_product=hypothetical protein / location=Cvel_scaffold1546:30028-31923(-) / protein_length=632 / sequence_SO=supercontig / SO=protein_coding / is_pseudo=false
MINSISYGDFELKHSAVLFGANSNEALPRFLSSKDVVELCTSNKHVFSLLNQSLRCFNLKLPTGSIDSIRGCRGLLQRFSKGLSKLCVVFSDAEQKDPNVESDQDPDAGMELQMKSFVDILEGCHLLYLRELCLSQAGLDDDWLFLSDAEDLKFSPTHLSALHRALPHLAWLQTLSVSTTESVRKLRELWPELVMHFSLRFGVFKQVRIAKKLKQLSVRSLRAHVRKYDRNLLYKEEVVRALASPALEEIHIHGAYKGAGGDDLCVMLGQRCPKIRVIDFKTDSPFSLDGDGLHVSDGGLQALSNAIKLEDFTASLCHDTGWRDDGASGTGEEPGIVRFLRLPRLKFVGLLGGLRGPIPQAATEAIGSSPTLERLWLPRVELDSSCLAAVSRAPALKYLHCSFRKRTPDSSEGARDHMPEKTTAWGGVVKGGSPWHVLESIDLQLSDKVNSLGSAVVTALCSAPALKEVTLKETYGVHGSLSLEAAESLGLGASLEVVSLTGYKGEWGGEGEIRHDRGPRCGSLQIAAICRAPKLRKLEIEESVVGYSMRLSLEAAKSIGECRALEELTLDGVVCGSEEVVAICRTPKLRDLSLKEHTPSIRVLFQEAAEAIGGGQSLESVNISPGAVYQVP